MDEIGVQLAFGGRKNIGGEVTLNHGEDGFGFGVTEAAVVLEDLGAVRGEHDAEVEEATVWESVCNEAGDGGLDDFFVDLGEEFGGGELAGGDSAHAACVRTLVGIANAFVVAGGHEDLIGVITDGDEDGDFRSGEALLDEKITSAKEAFFKDICDEGFGFGLFGADSDTFAGGEAVELEDDGKGGEGGFGFGSGGSDAESGSGNGVALEKFFGEDFGGFELGGFFAGAPAGDAGDGAEVGKAVALDEPGFLTGNAEVDGVGLHPGDEGREVGGGDAGGECFDGVAARAGEEFVIAGGSFQRGENGVFATAFACDEDFHGVG